MKFGDKQQNEHKTLKAIYHLTLEDFERATYIKEVQNATGLGSKDLQDVCKALQKMSYIEKQNFRIAITDEGVTQAEKLIEQSR